MDWKDNNTFASCLTDKCVHMYKFNIYLIFTEQIHELVTIVGIDTELERVRVSITKIAAPKYYL